MSASLVGSEMCIRDRGRVAERRWRPVTGTQAHALGELFAGGDVANVLEAVSYTHLTLPTICSV
eukprot:399370-Alexandrium_andersonii.AAC.1